MAGAWAWACSAPMAAAPARAAPVLRNVRREEVGSVIGTPCATRVVPAHSAQTLVRPALCCVTDFPSLAGEEDRLGDRLLAVGVIGDHATRQAERVGRLRQRQAVPQPPVQK